MEIKNLKAGQRIKDYRSLCALLCIKPTTGKAKEKQLERLSKYVKYRKVSNVFFIDEILRYPDPVTDSSSNSPYIKLIETLLLAYLVGERQMRIEATYKTIFQMLCMASSNYDKIYQDESYDYVCDNIAPISKEVYLDFRRSTYSENKKKIKSALDSMQNRALICYQEEMFVCYEDDEGKEQHRKPTEKEVVQYLKIRQALYDKYECSDDEDLKRKHLQKKYEEDLVEEIKNQLNWKYKYTKLVIINGVNDSIHLLEKSKQALIEQARKDKVEINKTELNQAIKKMINRIGETNHTNAVKRLEEWERGDEEWGAFAPQMPNSLYSILYRAKENYLPGWNILTEYYIGGDIDAARDKARDYSVSELDKASDDLDLEV